MRSRDLPNIVTVSEDATRVLSRIEYDPINNQIVGFVSPLDSNGIPKKLHFPASSAREIIRYFSKSRKSVNAILVMVQPIKDGTCY